MRYILLAFVLSVFASPVSADDGAASIAAGGLVLMKREPRIVMAKEVLNISPKKVDVSYEFRNDSAEDITTEVAFPIPAYSLCCDERNPINKGFNDFKLSVDTQEAKYATEARAYVAGRDITETLVAMHIDPSTFGHYSEAKARSADLERLSPEQRRRLVSMKAIQEQDGTPNAFWEVRKKYHWTQLFPPHATVQIRHAYTPWAGSSNSIGDVTPYRPKLPGSHELASFCPSSGLVHALQNEERRGNDFSLYYVDFILTTANTWKTPIEDFTLSVEKPAWLGVRRGGTRYVSFCWNGPVTKVDEQHFTAHLTNFVPGRELRIGYIAQLVTG